MMDNYTTHDQPSSTPLLDEPSNQLGVGTNSCEQVLYSTTVCHPCTMKESAQDCSTLKQDTATCQLPLQIMAHSNSDGPLIMDLPESMPIYDGQPSASSGAEIVQSAPTVSATPFERQRNSSVQPGSLAAAQQVSEGPFGAMNPARLLFCKGRDTLPLREHSASLNSAGILFNSNNLQEEIQNISQNDLPFLNIKLKDNQSFSLPKFPIIDSKNSTVSNLPVNPPKKLLDSSSDKFPMLESKKEACLQSTSNSVATDKLSVKKKLTIDGTRKGVSYSNAVAPPYIYQSTTTGGTPECGIILERTLGVSLDMYAWAISKITGVFSITFIGRAPNNDNSILIFVRNQKMAEEFVNKGVWIKGKWYNISFFQQPATKLVVSGVLPYIPDGLIVDAFLPYGKSVYPVLRKIPAAVRHQNFKGAFSYRREIYIIKNSPEVKFPDTLNVSFLGSVYSLGISTTGPKCFTCGSLQHTIGKCDQLESQSHYLKQGSTTDNSSPDDTNTQAVTHQVAPGSAVQKNSTVYTGKMTGSSVQPVVSKKDHYTQCNLLLSINNNNNVDSENDSKTSVTVKKKKKRKFSRQPLPSLLENNQSISIIDNSFPVRNKSSELIDNSHSSESKKVHTELVVNIDVETEVSTPRSVPRYDLEEPFEQHVSKKTRKHTNPSIKDAGTDFNIVPSYLTQTTFNHENESLPMDLESEHIHTLTGTPDVIVNMLKTSTNLVSKPTSTDSKNINEDLHLVSSKTKSVDLVYATSIANDWLTKSANLKNN